VHIVCIHIYTLVCTYTHTYTHIHTHTHIGPTATIEFAAWLLDMYTRDPWVQLLVDTRSIIVVPAANALGYVCEYIRKSVQEKNKK